MDDVAWTRRQLAQLESDAIAQRAALRPGLQWHDRVIRADDRAPAVTVRIYEHDRVSRPCGALLFFHGGAFVLGGLESEHERCLRWAQHGECVVVSVDYRLAPEHPYPAALNDGAAALAWLRENSASIGVDPQRIAVGGASAGGALAAGLALRTRDQQGPWLKAQILVYPVIDDRTATKSMEQFFQIEPWDAERTAKMWSHYLGDNLVDVSPYAAVGRATDLSDLPATYIMTAEEDPLRDEGIAYAQRLLDAGTSVELHHYARTFHGFDVVAPGSTLSELAITEQSAFIQRALAIRTAERGSL